MSRNKNQLYAAQREADLAAQQATQLRRDLTAQTNLEKERMNREKMKAQRILMRSLRAGSGGFFETDTQQGTLLGGTGVLG